MDLVLIDTFLSVCNNGNITKAASQLFVSQSTVSQRIDELEKELGVKLIVRYKGIRSIELTREGHDFLPIARRFSSLNNELENFATQEHRIFLTIASPDSINIHLFPSLFRDLLEIKPHINFRVRTHQSPEIYSLISNHEADVGFVFHRLHYKNILYERVLTEDMVLLVSSHGDWPKKEIHPSALDASYELFLPWSNEIALWHDNWWSSYPYAQFDTASMLINHMTHPKSWALCPISVARTYRRNPNILIRKCSEPIPPRALYMLIERNSKDAEQILLFRKYLVNFLDQLKKESGFSSPIV